MKINYKNQQGFTLVEMLIVIGVFAIIIAGTTNLLATIVRTSQKSEIIMKLKKSGGNTVSVMSRYLRSTTIIVGGDTICDNRELSPQISFIDMNDRPITYECTDNHFSPTLSIDGATTNMMDPNFNFTLSSCSISCYKNNRGYNVNFRFNLEAPSGEEDIFSSSVTLRNY